MKAGKQNLEIEIGKWKLENYNSKLENYNSKLENQNS